MRGPEKKKWAFLVYIAGDNDLSDAGIEDILELCDEGASEDVHVGVEIDTVGEHTGSIRYEITQPDWTGKAHRSVIERLPERDSGDPETLRSFLAWGMNRFPARNILVVVWNHGAGFRSVRRGGTRDVGYDDYGSSLDIPEVEQALARAGITRKRKIRILGFDACLMNMIEIAHHLKDRVDIIVGSQQTEPADGWHYDRVLRAVKEEASPQDLARRIVREYVECYRKQGIYNVTQSAVLTSKTAEVVRALGRLGRQLAADMKSRRKIVEKVRIEAQTFEMADYVDLVHLARLLAARIADHRIERAAETLARAASSCIIVSESIGGSVKDATGLSVWFPARREEYLDYRSKYLALKFNARGSGWVSFLDAYHA